MTWFSPLARSLLDHEQADRSDAFSGDVGEQRRALPGQLAAGGRHAQEGTHMAPLKQHAGENPVILLHLVLDEALIIRQRPDHIFHISPEFLMAAFHHAQRPAEGEILVQHRGQLPPVLAVPDIRIETPHLRCQNTHATLLILFPLSLSPNQHTGKGPCFRALSRPFATLTSQCSKLIGQ